MIWVINVGSSNRHSCFAKYFGLYTRANGIVHWVALSVLLKTNSWVRNRAPQVSSLRKTNVVQIYLSTCLKLDPFLSQMLTHACASPNLGTEKHGDIMLK